MNENNNLFIRNLSIEGYKSIKETDIELKPINIILGANGAGKSNLVSVFNFIRHYVIKKSLSYSSANRIFHFGTEETKEMNFKLQFNDFYYSTKFEADEETDNISTVEAEFSSDNDKYKDRKPNEVFDDVREELAKVTTYHFHNTSPKANVRSSHGVWDNINLHKDGANIASILYKIKSYGENPKKYNEDKDIILEIYYRFKREIEKLKQLEIDVNEKKHELKEKTRDKEHNYLFEDKDKELDELFEESWKIKSNKYRLEKKIKRLFGKDIIKDDSFKINDDEYDYVRSYNDILLSVRAVAPYFDDFVLEKEKDDLISLRWKNNANRDWVFDSSQLSDGTLRFILLATLLLQPAPPKVIVLDEPEIGLHPDALEVLSEIIKEVSEKTQVILTTQSVEFANLFKPEDFIIVDYEEDESKFHRLNEEKLKKWLEKYNSKIGDIWRKNIIGGRP